jgi:hypothetical protein
LGYLFGMASKMSMAEKLFSFGIATYVAINFLFVA